MAEKRRSRVVVVGAGFGGLWTARALAGSWVEVTLVDRHNYHTFLPLLYQVGAAELEPEGIARPARGIVRRWPGVGFVMAAVTGIDFERRTVATDGPLLPYDFLVLAPGSVTHFFGVPGAAEHAFELKSLAHGVTLRSHVIGCFERAVQADEAERRRLLTFLIVGGGATGVEYAGALAELVYSPLRRDYPELDFGLVRVVLAEAGPRLLSALPPQLGDYAAARLRRMGVEVRLAAVVDRVTPEVAWLGAEEIPCRTVVWTAGVRGDPAAQVWGLPVSDDGRVRVLPTLQAEGRPEVYVVGDLARAEEQGRPLPMVAPAATQEGTAAARNILRQLAGEAPLPFRYRDKGTMVTIGRNAAVVQVGGWSFTGFFAWLLWLGVHFVKLIGFRNRLLVLVDWAWDYLFFERAVRLILPEEQRVAAEGCALAPDAALRQAIEEFNSGAYFECHETLEELWLGESGPLRGLYQGILQVAAALLHLERGNCRGALILLEKGAGHLRPLAPACRQVDVAALMADTDRLRQALEALGPERCRAVEGGLIPRVRMVG